MKLGLGIGKFTLAVDLDGIRFDSLRTLAPVIGRRTVERGRAIAGDFVRGVGDGVHDVARSISRKKPK